MNFKKWQEKSENDVIKGGQLLQEMMSKRSDWRLSYDHIAGWIMSAMNEAKQAAQKELAKGILQETKFWQKKVTTEKCLNDTIERLEKEANKE